MKIPYLLFVCCVMLHAPMYTVWKIGTIYNTSDLTITSAWYIKPKKNKIDYLSNLIAQSPTQKKIICNYTVSDTSHGCSLLELSQGYTLSLDHHSPYALFAKRNKSKKKGKSLGKEMCDMTQHDHCARVFLEQTDASKEESLVAYTAKGYQGEKTVLHIKLSGSNGIYTVSLE